MLRQTQNSGNISIGDYNLTSIGLNYAGCNPLLSGIGGSFGSYSIGKGFDGLNNKSFSGATFGTSGNYLAEYANGFGRSGGLNYFSAFSLSFMFYNYTNFSSTYMSTQMNDTFNEH